MARSSEFSSSWIKTDISKKTQPCPICGKQDYCFFRQHSVDGNYEFFCHRSQTEGDVVGQDGKLYRFKRKSDSSNAIVYETDEDIRLRKGSIRAMDGKPTRPALQMVQRNEPLEGEQDPASVEERDRFNRSLAEKLYLSQKNTATLKKEWNTPNTPDLFEKVTKAYPILTLPPSDYTVSRYGYKGDKSLPRRKEIADAMSAVFGDIAAFPGFAINQYGNTIVGPEGMMFPIYDKDGKLVSWRIRCDYPDVCGQMPDGREGVFSHTYTKNGEESVTFYPKDTRTPEVVDINWPPKGKTQNKYKNLCSVYEKRTEDGKWVNGYGKGSRIGSLLSLYTQPNDNMSIVFITEGEKKAMVANILSHYPVVSVPGVQCFMKLFEKYPDGESMMDSLKRKGCKLVVVCYDADKSENQNVLAAQNGLAKALNDCQMQVAIGEWNANWGKGLDDIYVCGLKPTICPVRL